MRRLANGKYLRRIPLIAFGLVLVSLVAGIPAALYSEPSQAAPKDREKPQPAKKGKIYPVTYDVADLVQKSSPKSWVLDANRKAGQSGIETLVNLVLASVNPASWRGEGASSLQEVNGTRLEIRTSAAQHAQINDLLTAVRRLADLAVVVRSELFEVNRAFYLKEIEPNLQDDMGAPHKRFASLLDEALVRKFRKKAVLLKSNKVTIPNLQEAGIFSLRKALPYYAKPRRQDLLNLAHLAGTAKSRAKILRTAFYGMSFQAHVGVSADRRRVRLKVRQHVTNLVGMAKEKIVDFQTDKEITVEAPKLREMSITATVQVGDGRFILVPVNYQRVVKGPDNVLVLLVQPTIYIEEEERARKKIVPFPR